jgi:hypothetical protein
VHGFTWVLQFLLANGNTRLFVWMNNHYLSTLVRLLKPIALRAAVLPCIVRGRNQVTYTRLMEAETTNWSSHEYLAEIFDLCLACVVHFLSVIEWHLSRSCAAICFTTIAQIINSWRNSTTTAYVYVYSA